MKPLKLTLVSLGYDAVRLRDRRRGMIYRVLTAGPKQTLEMFRGNGPVPDEFLVPGTGWVPVAIDPELWAEFTEVRA